MHSYQDLKLPTNWMLDSGIMSKVQDLKNIKNLSSNTKFGGIVIFIKHIISIFNPLQIKQASMNLAKMYMKRVKTELDSVRSSDKESNHESLLLQGIHFAYRTHQVSNTML